ncbi:cell surface A33 antigen-like isoform X2 [Anneissia japonica]|nr:cell surface A33 antigen-like isoform X2 [Anneissia japonica]
MSMLFITATLTISVFSLCSSVIVTVSVDGKVVEGQETRLDCTIQKNSIASTRDPFITWLKVVNGSSVTIVEYQRTPGSVQPPYNKRFSLEGDDSKLTLVIDDTMQDDHGTYECFVSLIDDPPSPESDTVTIIVEIPNKKNDGNNGLSTGVIVAIVFGVLCSFALVCVGVAIYTGKGKFDG